ncbi:hypothetical protein TNCT_392931 [Trichonephila clavata]|uniref:Uncharacterized protein n=1 Tax=Trichonephila clavata TaxID=2740835 RepID=A0A8X6L277_TRICU|nr:hypothetical protein TNCT_392931 [Trichonephila clavata]
MNLFPSHKNRSKQSLCGTGKSCLETDQTRKEGGGSALIVFSQNAADNSGSGRARQTGSGTPGAFALPADLSEPLLPTPFSRRSRG